jgi:uncharacterized integral membrane protein
VSYETNEQAEPQPGELRAGEPGGPGEQTELRPGEQTFPESATDAASVVPRPRVRSGAIAWGLIVIAVGVALLAIVWVPRNASAFATWTASLTPGGIVVIGLIALGAFILLMALLSMIRRAQHRRTSAG